MFDDPGFPDQGTASAGVARQHSGTLGKMGSGQVAVTCCGTDPQASWPVAVRLDVPQAWADDPDRRRMARAPCEVTFQTTPEIALTLLDRARVWEVPCRGVAADADDGDRPNCLVGLEERRGRSGEGVRAD